MKRIRQYSLLIGILWLTAITALDLIVPLHFFVKEHRGVHCNANDKDCCQKSETACAICHFDLYIGFIETYKPLPGYQKHLLAVFDWFYFVAPSCAALYFYSLRAPPVICV